MLKYIFGCLQRKVKHKWPHDPFVRTRVVRLEYSCLLLTLFQKYLCAIIGIYFYLFILDSNKICGICIYIYIQWVYVQWVRVSEVTVSSHLKSKTVQSNYRYYVYFFSVGIQFSVTVVDVSDV